MGKRKNAAARQVYEIQQADDAPPLRVFIDPDTPACLVLQIPEAGVMDDPEVTLDERTVLLTPEAWRALCDLRDVIKFPRVLRKAKPAPKGAEPPS